MTETPRLAIAAAVCLALQASAAPVVAAPPVSLEAARRALAEGDAARAATLYETLAQQGESLEAEIGLVRASLQAGEFRKAMSFANLTAGEHPDSVEAAALLAYLNDRVGRTEQALEALKRLEASHPDEQSALAAHADILIDRLAPAQALSLIQTWRDRHPGAQAPELVRLFARAQAAARGNVAAGNGVIIDDGKSVLTYAGLLKSVSGREVLIRNSLGQVRRARADARGAANDLVRLRLKNPFPSSQSVPLSQVAAPEGVRFCFALGFSVPGSVEAAYPAIAPGLVFRANAGAGGLMQITSALGAGHDGAPIFDPRGRLIGLALGAGDHQIAGQDLHTRFGKGSFALRVDETLTGVARQASTTRAPAGPQPPMPAVEELFERLAPAVVQIVALD